MTLEVAAGTPDRGKGVVTLCIVFIVVIVVATGIRITSKLVTRQKWWWDDLFAIFSLVTALIMLGMVFAWRDIGLGYHMEVVARTNPQYLIDGARYLFVAVFFFGSSICFPKLSAVFFYARVFRSNNRAFLINLWIVSFLVSGWLIAGWLVAIFQCSPVAKAWNDMLPGTCINQYNWYLSTSILSTVIDGWILLLPLPMIWSLHISLRRRIYLLVCFFMSYSVIVLSIGRIAAVTSVIPAMKSDLTWEFPLYLYWIVLECAISIVSINVPSGIALVKAIMDKSQGSSGDNSNSASNITSTSQASGSAVKNFGNRVPYDDNERESIDPLVPSTVSSRANGAKDTGYSLGEIKVRTDIQITSRV